MKPWERYGPAESSAGPWEKYGQGQASAPAPTPTPTPAAIPDDQIDGAFIWQKQPNALQTSVGFFLNQDEDARADIIRKNVPGAEFGRDAKGRQVVRQSGDDKYSYINAPGIGAQDVVDFAGDVVKFAPAAKVAGLGAGILSRMAIGAPAAALTSAAADAASGGFGSEQNIDPTKAGVAAIGAGIGEVVAPLAGAGLRAGRRLLRGPAADRVAEDAAEFAARNPAQVRQRGMQLTPDQSRAAQQVAEEFQTPLSRGQQTGDVNQIAWERGARAGTKGDPAAERTGAFFGRQEDDLRGAATGLAGRRVSSDLTDAGDMVVKGVTRKKRMADNAINQAYRLARSSNATIDAEAVPRLVDGIRAAVVPELSNPSVFSSARGAARRFPQASRVLNDLTNAPQRIIQAGDEAGGRVVGIDFQMVESLRKDMINAWKAADPGSPDRLALTQMKAALDGWVDDVAMKALAGGDPSTIEAFKKARALNAQFARTFTKDGADDLGGQIVEDIINKDMTAEQSINTIFGAADIGGKRGSLAAVKRLKTILGNDAPEWQALREAQIERLMRKGFGEGGDRFNPGTFRTALDKALRGGGREIMDELFSPEEIARMKRFRFLVDRITPPRDAVNPSGSGYVMERFWRSVFGGLPGGQIASDLMGASRASQAVRGLTAPTPSRIVPSGGAALATARERAPGP